MIDWSAFYANGGWQGDCDPAAYDDGRDDEENGTYYDDEDDDGYEEPDAEY